MKNKGFKVRAVKKYQNPRMVCLTIIAYIVAQLSMFIFTQPEEQALFSFSSFILTMPFFFLEHSYQNRNAKKLKWKKWVCMFFKESPLLAIAYVLSLVFCACMALFNLYGISESIGNVTGYFRLPEIRNLLNVSVISSVIMGLFTVDQIKKGIQLSQHWAQQEADEAAQKVRYRKGDSVF